MFREGERGCLGEVCLGGVFSGVFRVVFGVVFRSVWVYRV